MIGFFNKHKKTIFTITVIVFIVSIFFGLGAYIGEITIGDTVAKIGKRKISYSEYQKMVSIYLNRVLKENKDINSDEAYKVIEGMVKEEVFKELVVDEILKMEAQKFGFKVSDFEVAMEIQNTPTFLVDGRFDPRSYVGTIWANYRMTPKEYEEWRRNSRLSGKFKSFLFETVKVTPDEVVFYKGLIKTKDLKDEKQFSLALKQQKFYDIANSYLRTLVSTIEIKDYRKKFEKKENT